MKHVLSILTEAAETAEKAAANYETCAGYEDRDGNHEKAQNLRDIAVMERAKAAECREVLPILQIMATVKQETAGMSEEELKELQTAMLAEMQQALSEAPDNLFLQGHVEALTGETSVPA